MEQIILNVSIFETLKFKKESRTGSTRDVLRVKASIIIIIIIIIILILLLLLIIMVLDYNNKDDNK